MKRIFIVTVCCLFCYTLSSQSISPYIVSTKGGSFVNSASSLTWTLGQVASTSLFSVNNILSQGFQQPYYFNPINIPEVICSTTDIQIFPNPTSDIINIIYSSSFQTSITIELLDLLGNKLKPDIEKKTDEFSKKLVINLQDLKSGIYIIRVFTKSSDIIEVFKIVKIE